VIGNVPRSDFQARQDRVKNQPPRFVTIALISPMKNIHRIIEALAQVGKPAEYHLCGPVKDSAYWRECQERVKKLPAEVVFRYHGAIRRPQVEAALASCDFYVQPSRSENFGHSIFESLVAGVPAITSSTTPWTAIEKAKAGFIVDPDDQQGLLESLRGAIEMPPGVYAEYCSNARAFSRAYLRRTDFKNRYRELFKE
jgi:glycosyltransferase involved in cell wall biosynthesis